jgi:hypothetical protein
MKTKLRLSVGDYFVWASDPSRPTLCRVTSKNKTHLGFKQVGTDIRLTCPPDGLLDFEDITRENLSKCKSKKAKILLKDFPQAKLKALRRVEVPVS